MIDNYDLYSISEISVENIKFSLLTGHSEKSGDTVNVLHTHSFYEAFICVKGEIKIETEKGTVTLTENSVAVVPPMLYHKSLNTFSGPEQYTLGYTFERLDKTDNEIYSHFLISNESITVIEDIPAASGALFAAVRESQTGTPDKALKIFTALDFALSALHKAEKEENKKMPLPEFISHIDTIVNYYYAEKITLEDISEHLHLSKRQITRIMNKYYGKTFFKLLNDKRIEVAEHMLKTTGNAVDKISAYVGYESLNGFYREFKKRNGVTPADYRKG